jgi:hypothetical protein
VVESSVTGAAQLDYVAPAPTAGAENGKELEFTICLGIPDLMYFAWHDEYRDSGFHIEAAPVNLHVRRALKARNKSPRNPCESAPASSCPRYNHVHERMLGRPALFTTATYHLVDLLAEFGADWLAYMLLTDYSHYRPFPFHRG